MKIVYVSNDVLLVHDQKFLVKYLEYGHEIHYVSLIRRQIKDHEKMEGINYYTLPVKNKAHEKKYPNYLYPFRYFSSLRLVNKVIDEVNPDVLHGGFIQISGFISACTGRKPFILMPFGHDVLYYEKFPYFVKKMTNFTTKIANHIVVDAEYVKDKLVEFTSCNPSKISVFPWGVERSIFNENNKFDLKSQFGWTDNKIVVTNRGFLSRFDIMTTIRAIPEIVAKHSDCRFLIIGTGDIRNKNSTEYQCKRLVLDLGISKYVKFHPWMPNNQMPKYLASSDIYVTTSTSDGSSVSLMEAIACGLPVVVTEVPAFFEWVEDGKNGFIVPIGNSDLVANRIIKLLEDSVLRKQMSQRNLALASKRADWDRNYEILEKVYSEALGEVKT